MSIGNRIKIALNAQGITQKELSEKTGLTEVSISRYIADTREPNAQNIIKICKTLHITSDWLLGMAESDFVTIGLDSFCAMRKIEAIIDEYNERIKK